MQTVPQWPFTEAALLNEVRDMIAAVMTGAESSVFGAGTLRFLVGEDGGDDSLWRDNVDLGLRSIPDAMNLLYRIRQILPVEVDPDRIDVHRYPATFSMRALYDYVVHTRWPSGVHLDDILTQAITFTEMAAAADEITGGFGEPRLCNAVIERAKARGRLDCLRNGWMNTIWTEEGVIDYCDLAYLANIDERTVRNATLRNDERGLRTTSFDGKKGVDPTEASRWLAMQPDFRSTEFYELPERKSFEATATVSDHFQYWQFQPRKKAPVVKLSVVAAKKEEAGELTAEVMLTENNLRSHSLPVTTVMHNFPPDVVGGSSKREQAPERLTVEFPDESMCITDIDGRKKILRDRGSISRFYAAHELKAGDRVRIRWLGERRIRLEPSKSGS